jgi:hypothetical protein
MASTVLDPFLITGPFNAVTRLAQLNVSPIENAPSRRFHLRGFAAFGTATILAPDSSTYRVSLRQAFLETHTLNCLIDPGTIREDIVQDGAYSEGSSTSQDSVAAAEGGLHAGINLSQLTAPGHFGARLGAKMAKRSRAANHAKSRRVISRVEYVGGGWRFGSQNGGDPIKGFGSLDGKYLDGAEPWAGFSFHPQSTECEITLQLKLPHGMLVVEQADRPATYWSLGPISVKRQMPEVDPKAIAIDALKSVVAGLVVAESIQSDVSGSGYDAATGELLLGFARIQARALPDAPLSPIENASRTIAKVNREPLRGLKSRSRAKRIPKV